MKTILNWKQKQYHLPISNYVWSKILSKAFKSYLVKEKILYFTGSKITYLHLNSFEYHIDCIEEQLYAFCADETCEEDEIAIENNDILELRLDFKSLSDFICKALNFSNASTKSKYSDDIYCLGKNGDYAVFFVYNSHKLEETVDEYCKETKPFIIHFDSLNSEDMSMLNFHNAVEYVITDVLEFKQNTLIVKDEIIELLNPNTKYSKDIAYSWDSLISKRVYQPKLKELTMQILSTYDVKISLGGDTSKFCIDKFSLFWDKKLNKPNKNWNLFFACSESMSYKDRDVSENTLRTAIKRMNRDFRDFFRFTGSAFTFKNDAFKIYSNFKLVPIKKEDNRQYSVVIDGVCDELSDKEDFKYPTI